LCEAVSSVHTVNCSEYCQVFTLFDELLGLSLAVLKYSDVSDGAIIVFGDFMSKMNLMGFMFIGSCIILIVE